MSDLLTTLDRAAREWADAERRYGQHWDADAEEWGDYSVSAERARKAYEEALEAVRAEREALRKALRDALDVIAGHRLRATEAETEVINRAEALLAVRAQMQERSR